MLDKDDLLQRKDTKRKEDMILLMLIHSKLVPDISNTLKKKTPNNASLIGTHE
jgi:hypothetical protein